MTWMDWGYLHFGRPSYGSEQLRLGLFAGCFKRLGLICIWMEVLFEIKTWALQESISNKRPISSFGAPNTTCLMLIHVRSYKDGKTRGNPNEPMDANGLKPNWSNCTVFRCFSWTATWADPTWAVVLDRHLTLARKSMNMLCSVSEFLVSPW